MARSKSDEESEHHGIVALARRHIGMGGRVFYAPAIPRDKEPVAVLHDETFFGSENSGAVASLLRQITEEAHASARKS